MLTEIGIVADEKDLEKKKRLRERVSLIFSVAIPSWLLCMTFCDKCKFPVVPIVLRNKRSYKTSIDHFHKWRRIFYSFVFMLIRPTGLTLVETFF